MALTIVSSYTFVKSFVISTIHQPTLFKYSTHSKNSHQQQLYNSNSNDATTTTINNEKLTPELNDFLAKAGAKEWKGSRTMLQRRGELPDIKYKPIDVIRICLRALQANDYPQLDHGACVVLEFKSPTGPLSLFPNPAIFGHYLRNNENDYHTLLDFKEAKAIGEPVTVTTTNEIGLGVGIDKMETIVTSIQQRIEIILFPDYKSNVADERARDHKVHFNFFLSLHDGFWLIDAIHKV